MFKWLGQRPEKRKQKTRQLWESEFNIVKEGLEEEQVVAFVDNLLVQYRASQQASAVSLRSLIEKAVADAEQIAANIKMQAQTEAEEEATRTINQAKQEADEIRGRAEVAAQKEAEDIIAVSKKKAELAEVETKQKALLFLLGAREEIEREVRGDYKQAHSRLLSTLENLMSEGQNITTELKDKRERLWEGQRLELKGAEAALLSAAEVVAPPPETLAPTPTQVEPDIASKEKTEEPVQLEKEATEEGVEQPTELQEEAVEEKVEEFVQLQEEAVEEKVEQPTQLQEEAPVSEPAEEATEESLGQHPPEEIPGREETDSTQLKPGDNQTLYVGEIELAIGIPVELKMVSKFYNFLQTIPDIKILRTTGSWDRGTTITVVADKPIPLISEISEVPDVEVIPELPQKDSSEKGASSSRLRGGGKGITTRIKLTLKEAQSP